MEVFAREPVGSVEGRNLAPDLAFLTLEAAPAAVKVDEEEPEEDVAEPEDE